MSHERSENKSISESSIQERADALLALALWADKADAALVESDKLVLQYLRQKLQENEANSGSDFQLLRNLEAMHDRKFYNQKIYNRLVDKAPEDMQARLAVILKNESAERVPQKDDEACIFYLIAEKNKAKAQLDTGLEKFLNRKLSTLIVSYIDQFPKSELAMKVDAAALAKRGLAFKPEQPAFSLEYSGDFRKDQHVLSYFIGGPNRNECVDINRVVDYVGKHYSSLDLSKQKEVKALLDTREGLFVEVFEKAKTKVARQSIWNIILNVINIPWRGFKALQLDYARDKTNFEALTQGLASQKNKDKAHPLPKSMSFADTARQLAAAGDNKVSASQILSASIASASEPVIVASQVSTANISSSRAVSPTSSAAAGNAAVAPRRR